MDQTLEDVVGKLRTASDLGLLSHPEEVGIILELLEAARKDVAQQFREYHSLKTAFDILEGVVADQSSRIKALEDAIRSYLDPSQARSGVSELQTVLIQELGCDPD
jgi:hypothetical protein